MTSLRTALSSILLAFFCVLTFCNSAQAGTSTLVTTSGQKFALVIYEVDQEKQLIRVEIDGWKQPIKFKDIQAIYDGDGKDITAAILSQPTSRTVTESASPKVEAPQETWRAKNDPVLTQKNRALWSVSFHLGTCGTLPTTSYYEGFTSGVGYGGDMEISCTRDVSLLLSVWRAGVRAGDDLKFVSYDPDVTILEQKITMRTMRYFISGLYHQPLNKDRPLRGHWYAGSGIGVIDDHPDGSGIALRHSDNTLYQLMLTGGGSHFAITAGAGYVVMFSPGIGIDFGAGCDQLFAKSTNGNSTGSAFLLNLRLALVLAIPVKQQN